MANTPTPSSRQLYRLGGLFNQGPTSPTIRGNFLEYRGTLQPTGRIVTIKRLRFASEHTNEVFSIVVLVRVYVNCFFVSPSFGLCSTMKTFITFLELLRRTTIQYQQWRSIWLGETHLITCKAPESIQPLWCVNVNRLVSMSSPRTWHPAVWACTCNPLLAYPSVGPRISRGH